MSDNQPHGVFGDGKLAGAILDGALGGATSGPLMGAIKGAVVAAVKEKIVEKAGASAVAGTTPSPGITRDEAIEIATAAAAKVAATPEGQYSTGQDPWYKSRAVWSALTGVATPILAIAGYTLSPEVRECVAIFGVAFGPVVAGTIVVVGGSLSAALAWWERRASKPIGG